METAAKLAPRPRAVLALAEDDSGTKEIEALFERVEAAYNRALIESTDLDAFSEVFAESFIAANPNGIACWRNDGNLLAVLKQGFEFYRALGAKSARITALSVTPLDDSHSVAKVGWEMLFAKRDGSLEPFNNEVFYLVQTIAHEPRIFSFITPDERELFRERGFLRTA